jgi:hypothetical protein
MFSIRFTSTIILSTIILAACPGDGNDDTGNSTTSTTSSITAPSTTPDETSTGTTEPTVTTAMDETSTGDAPTSTGEDTSTGDPATCGPPAAECTTVNRDWCPDLLALCEARGLDLSAMGGTNYCANLNAQCMAGASACDECFYLANTCSQLPTGIACESAAAECLCRAVAHEIELN